MPDEDKTFMVALNPFRGIFSTMQKVAFYHSYHFR